MNLASGVIAIFLLVGCGEAFTASGLSTDLAVDGGALVEVDARDEADAAPEGAVVAAGGSGSEDAGAGGRVSSGGAGAGGVLGAGGESAGGAGAGGAPEVPEPPCCADADCPASIPFCSPWGTCYQGGDPYACNYDFHCESYCYHCRIGMQGGTCNDQKSCDCV